MTDGKTPARPGTKAFEITSKDVEGLITNLGAIAGKLTRGEWGLLLSIFAAAASNVKVDKKETTKGTFSGVATHGVMITDPKRKDIEKLLNQLRKAHMPGNKGTGAPLLDMVLPPNDPGGSGGTPPKKAGT